MYTYKDLILLLFDGNITMILKKIVFKLSLHFSWKYFKIYNLCFVSL